MQYASGGEHVSAFPSLETVKRERLHSRLVGDFEWSLYQRRFDGVRVDLDRPAWQLTSSAFVATQGGFEESANLSMPKVQIAGLAFTRQVIVSARVAGVRPRLSRSAGCGSGRRQHLLDRSSG